MLLGEIFERPRPPPEILTFSRCGPHSSYKLTLPRRWILRIPETKNGRMLVLPLPSGIRSELRQLGEKREGWIFAARFGDGHLTRIDNAWGRIRIRAGLDDVRMHDLRRTFATIAHRQECGIDDIAAALNHSSSAVTRSHYVIGAVDKRAEVIAAVGKYVKRKTKKPGAETPGLA